MKNPGEYVDIGDPALQVRTDEDGKPVMDDYTFLASTWAVPELDIDGDIVECFRMEHEVPGWGSDTKWPKSALDILSSEEMEMLNV